MGARPTPNHLTNRSSRRRFVARFWAFRYASPKPHHSRRGLTQVLGSMSDIFDPQNLLWLLQRALLGEVHPQLRQASIEADPKNRVVKLRFEYDGEPSDLVRESCSCVATEVLADFPAPWELDEQHIAVAFPQKLTGLNHIAYLRWEPEHAA